MENNCPVCGGVCSLLDVMDINKSCGVEGDKAFPLAGIPVYYVLCGQCGFCFAPELYAWTLEQYETQIYNDGYAIVDPGYLEDRPRSNAGNLVTMFAEQGAGIRHLDYGGGNGLLAKLLRESNWQSTSYDPFVDRDVDIVTLGKFDLITAYEVFEHVPDVQQLMRNISALLSDDGIVLFSTLLSDGNIHANQRLTWWYAAPRNGHISLFSKNSLAILAQSHGFNLGSFSVGFHVFFKTVPVWAKHIIRVGS